MRNLQEFPIHLDEIVMRLNALAGEAMDSDVYGALDPLILQKAAEIVRAASGVLDGIDKRLSTKVDKFPDSIRWHTPWKEATALVNAFADVRRKG